MRAKVKIRVDGNARIGLGHVMRCLALAQMLQEKFDIDFICKEVPDTFAKELPQKGFSLVKITEESNFLNEIGKDEIVILDGYDFDAGLQKMIKGKGCRLVCIDDIHDKDFYADLIINHAPNIYAEFYKALPYTQFALGPNYALLRPPFLNSKGKSINQDLNKLFICFGGSDPTNLTLRCLQVARSKSSFSQIIVVVGEAYQYFDHLEKETTNDMRVKIHRAVDEEKMASLISSSGLAIIPSSGILLEVLSCGCKAISGMYADNQKFVYFNYKNSGAFIDAGDFSSSSLNAAIDIAMNHANELQKNFIDGMSGKRMLKLFTQLKRENEIHMERVSEDDLNTTFEWAVDKRIRAFSFSQNEISFEEHKRWFLEKISNEECYYFIARDDRKSVGSIRFDIKDNSAIISYLVDGTNHGQGLGVVLLKKGIEELLKTDISGVIKEIVGFVIPENIASVKAFERLGFSKNTIDNNIRFFKRI